MSTPSRNEPPDAQPVDPNATNPPRSDPPEKAEVEAYTQTSPNDIKQYIEAAAGATQRSRRVLIILITASVLALVATWNSRTASWFNERYRVTAAALMLFDKNNNRLPLNDPEVVKLLQEGDNLYARADAYLKHRKVIDRDIIVKRLERLDIQRLEHVTTVKMPFFGVGFDVNDIGIFAGFTFSVVLLWFRFSLLREVNNLRLAFFEARNQDRAKAKEAGRPVAYDKLRFCYEMLAMRQVLSTPKMLPQDKPATFFTRLRQVFWVLVSKSLFLLPLAVQAIVIRNDMNSIEVGKMISPHNTELVMALSWIFLSIIVALTALCFLLIVRSNRTWNEAAKDLSLE